MEYIHGGDIYTYTGMTDFSVNVGPFGPSMAVMEAARKAVAEIGNYPDSRCGKLREALEKDTGIPGKQFVFGNGAAELIYDVVRAVRPKKAVISVPTFAEYEQALQTEECEILYHEKKEEEGFALGEDFLEFLRDDVDIVFLCSPDNPSGRSVPKGLLRKILRICEEKQIFMVLDECFLDFMENASEMTMIKEAAKSSYLMVIRAFTKMHAMPGLRSGYAVSRNESILEKMERCRQPWNVSIPAQAASLAALKEKKRVQTTREFITRERKWMEEGLAEIGVTFFPSEVNYILLKSDLDLFEKMKEYRILIRDCSNYRGLERGFYRIAIRQRGDNHRLLEALYDIYSKSVKVEETEETDGEIDHDPGNDV